MSVGDPAAKSQLPFGSFGACLYAKALFVCVCAYVYICVEVFMLIHVIFG